MWKVIKDVAFEVRVGSALRKIGKINYVNNGGCAIVAYGLVKHIEKYYPKIPAKVVYLFRGWDTSYTNIKNNDADSCGHAVVKIGDKYYDTDGGQTLKSLGFEHSCEVDMELVLDSLNLSWCWNQMFDRESGVPKICEALQLDAKVLDCIEIDV